MRYYKELTHRGKIINDMEFSIHLNCHIVNVSQSWMNTNTLLLTEVLKDII